MKKVLNLNLAQFVWQKMVQNFIKESDEKSPLLFHDGHHGCNCFNGNYNDSSRDEFDVFSSSGGRFD
ncbi:conserved hypothetical protein [Ricinus communis]|uniref:Uncharacterized protein n=1 Tax=Ricinus communis TaxID=3988 RepID=B9T5W0_RICCO|nr:conserved hypothetical protein [Ricinus communis]